MKPKVGSILTVTVRRELERQLNKPLKTTLQKECLFNRLLKSS